jgi:integrase
MSEKPRKSGPKNPRMLTHNGLTLSLGQWARKLGISDGTLRSRLDKLGLAVAEALTRPVDKRFDPAPVAALAPTPAPPLKRDERGRAMARWTEGGIRRKKLFGPWGDRETIAAYNRWAAEWHASGGRTPPADVGDISVAGLVIRCLEWAAGHFTKGGKPTSEVAGFRAALGTLNELYGDEPASSFTPTKLRSLQDKWKTSGKAMTTCNAYLSYVVRCWSWGVSRDLVPAAVADALTHVPRLVAGRGGVVPPEPVPPVTDADFFAALPGLDSDPDRRRVYEAILLLQRHSGMRPGEALELRAEDVDRSREPWRYDPLSGGKALHHGKARRVWIGPHGRAVLVPFLAIAETGKPVFRVTRIRTGELMPVRIEWLRAAIARGCELAGVPVWTPHQVRHAKATEVQRKYEDDAAVAAALGNTPEVARQVYVDAPADAVAKRIAEELG